MDANSPTPDPAGLLEFMFRLGQAYLASGEQTAKIELNLRRIATACGIRRSRVVVFPTAVFISLHDASGERVTISEGATQTLRLDQIGDVYALGDMAQRGEIAPQDGLKRLNDILSLKPRFGAVGVILGHTILSVGLALVLMPAVSNLLAVALLGTLVGAAKVANRNRPILAVPMPVVAAAIVAATVDLAVKWGLPVDPQYVLVPPLVAFLPGSMLTLGMVELAFGDMVSGASRLMTGLVQLLLLAFGLAAGALLVGGRPEELLDRTAQLDLTSWVPWLGVVVFGIGVYLHFSAPRRSFLWMLVVLLVAFAAQRVTTVPFGQEISGFFGMLVATPLGYLIQLRFNGPPAMVTSLPTFWLLVPGAMGLLSLTQIVSDRAAAFDGLITVVTALTSIALGTLVGASLYKSLTETFGWWRLQLGRAGSYFRKNRKR